MKSVSASIDHIRYLSDQVGARGSCTADVRRAGEYAARVLSELGGREVRSEPFRGAPSTYQPFVLAFLVATVGSTLALLAGSRAALAAGAALNGLGVWAMFADTEFAPHWARWLSAWRLTQNVCGMMPPSGAVQRRAVLCAHLDTHRTPVFYSSAGWQRLFGLLVGGCFASMLLGALIFALAATGGWLWLRWLAVLLLPVQLFALAMVAAADFTPFSPGANDNASGVGVALALAARLAREPLRHTEVHLLLTDCEETGAWGMRAFLDRHARSLGDDCVYIAIDQVGAGQVRYLVNDGLVVKHPTHPRALELARRARQATGLDAAEMPGTAYTDALPATLRGRVALTLCSVPAANAAIGAHWHQMSDRSDVIDPRALADAEQFTWQVLQEIDAA